MNNNFLVKQEISKHPIYGLKRFVVIRNCSFQSDYEQITFEAHIEYYTEDMERDTSLKDEILDWVVNNTTKTTVRNSDGTPKENPSYTEGMPESERYLKLPSYTYFHRIVTDETANAIPLVPLLRKHIILNDAELKFFDKIKLGTRV